MAMVVIEESLDLLASPYPDRKRKIFNGRTADKNQRGSSDRARITCGPREGAAKASPRLCLFGLTVNTPYVARSQAARQSSQWDDVTPGDFWHHLEVFRLLQLEGYGWCLVGRDRGWC